MKELEYLLVESTDVFISDRITIYYYGSTEKQPKRVCSSISLTVGHLELLMQVSLHQNVHRMLRNMLMAINIYPLYLKWQERGHSRIIRGFSEKRFFKQQVKNLQKLTIEDLRKGAFNVMALIQTSFCGGQLKIEYSPDVRDLTLNLNTSVLCLIDLLKRQEVGQEKLKPFLTQGS